jgi:hypothetical protein
LKHFGSVGGVGAVVGAVVVGGRVPQELVPGVGLGVIAFVGAGVLAGVGGGVSLLLLLVNVTHPALVSACPAAQHAPNPNPEQKSIL